ncbi:MAG: hypothetical protein AAFZ15_25785 [Bacteroidota bacterium]
MRLNQINNLSELLQALQTETTPMFINLCSRCGNDNFLTDQIVSNLQKEYGEKLGYQKLPSAASEVIKQELHISKNPVLLLIKDGEIKALFGGIIAQYRLEMALYDLRAESPNSTVN